MKTVVWRRSLKALVPVYAAAIAAKETLLERGWLKQQTLAHPVISVGSLSAGGAGKTPVVLMLAELLARRGYEVRILTRGYGRERAEVQCVELDGDAKRFGDEPLMMARKLARLLPRVAVWVGVNRHRAGRISEEHDLPGGKVVYLLDDGFQHRKLARDVDVVLLTRQELSDSLLPVGNLREPLKAMLRADIVVLREEEGFAGEISGKATWFTQRQLVFPAGDTLPKRTVAFCGLARPEGFFAMLAPAGIDVVAVSVFRDHHAYSLEDVAGLLKLARLHGAEGFVTTEKDAVKLTDAMRERLLQHGALLVPELRVSLRSEEEKLAGLVSLIEGKSPGKIAH